MTGSSRTLAVALHDIEPATFERCALIRDWLDDHGVNRVTLLVIPARDLHPLAERSPEIVNWLIEHERSGDAIAQHGFQHLRSRRARTPHQALRGIGGCDEAEFVGLDVGETRRAVGAGRRVLKLAGIEPRGFVAPAYAYTPALHRTLGEHFHWWAARLGLHRSQPAPMRIAWHEEHRSNAARIDASRHRDKGHRDEGHHDRLGPPLALMSSGRLRRALAPALLRAGALVSGSTLRLDLYPSDLDHPSHMLALEWVLKRSAAAREAVTYDELAFAASDIALEERALRGQRIGARRLDGTHSL